MAGPGMAMRSLSLQLRLRLHCCNSGDRRRPRLYTAYPATRRSQLRRSLDLARLGLQVIRDKTTLLSRSFGFVTYNSPYAAASAMQHMNGVPLFQGLFQGRALKVGPSHRR